LLKKFFAEELNFTKKYFRTFLLWKKNGTRIRKEVHMLFSGGIGSTRPNPHRQNLYLLPHSDKKDSKREKEEAITDVLAKVGCVGGL
jgi:hypothetical protein